MCCAVGTQFTRYCFMDFLSIVVGSSWLWVTAIAGRKIGEEPLWNLRISLNQVLLVGREKLHVLNMVPSSHWRVTECAQPCVRTPEGWWLIWKINSTSARYFCVSNVAWLGSSASGAWPLVNSTLLVPIQALSFSSGLIWVWLMTMSEKGARSLETVLVV